MPVKAIRFKPQRTSILNTGFVINFMCIYTKSGAKLTIPGVVYCDCEVHIYFMQVVFIFCYITLQNIPFLRPYKHKNTIPCQR